MFEKSNCQRTKQYTRNHDNLTALETIHLRAQILAKVKKS